MKWFLLPALFAMAIGFAGCTPKSSFDRVQVTKATFEKVADIRDPKTLAKIENLLAKRESAAPTDADFSYVLEIQSSPGRTFWHYNADGSGAEIRDGKFFAFFKIKDAPAFNQLIGLGNHR